MTQVYRQPPKTRCLPTDRSGLVPDRCVPGAKEALRRADERIALMTPEQLQEAGRAARADLGL